MKAIISSTYDDNYFWNIPLAIWAWNKIDVEVICFSPVVYTKDKDYEKWCLLVETVEKNKLKGELYDFYTEKHKAATYSQNVRLYAACLNLPEGTILITADVDILPFSEYLKQFDGNIQLFGADLLEGEKMYPMCYCSATVAQWRSLMNITDESYQEKLDSTIGVIEAEHFRGNFWCRDQENLFNAITTSIIPITKHNRAKLPERFATRRLDREDSFLMERDVTDVIDFHLPRPGYEHFDKILTILLKIYPQEDFTWLETYNSEYKKLL